MHRKILFTVLATLCLFIGATAPVQAVGIRSHGGINSGATQGSYIITSEQGGLGNFTPGSTVDVDSYLFQCRTRGSAACSTQWNSDATLVQKWTNSRVVPQLNASTSTIEHTFNNLPYGRCGRIQYDQGVAGVSGAIGGWVHDFGTDCSVTSTCAAQQPVVTRFRFSGKSTSWTSGSELTAAKPRVGQKIDVNCFAKNGSALLEQGAVDVRLPNGQTYRAATVPDMRDFTLLASGTYTFTCTSQSIAQCESSANVTVVVPSPTPTPSTSPRPSISPTPQPTPTPSVVSSCNSLEVVSGNDSNIPARVTLRAQGSDSRGNIQGYRFYFGDGTRVDSATNEVTHEYNMSGTFVASAEIKDSTGNYKTSNSCQTQVRVKSSSVESHKSGCSDIFINTNNNGKAPAIVTFNINGYDNKGAIQQYRIDFGNGTTRDSDSRTFEETYNNPGTYQIRAYIKNSQGQWVGDAGNCRRSMTIGSNVPLKNQPSTGSPTQLLMLALGSGVVGTGFELARRRKAL